MNMGATLLDKHLLDAWQQEQDFLEKLSLEHQLIYCQLAHGPEEHPEITEAAMNRMHHIENTIAAPRSKVSTIMQAIALGCKVEDAM